MTCCNPIWVVKTRLQLQTNVDPELISLHIYCLNGTAFQCISMHFDVFQCISRSLLNASTLQRMLILEIIMVWEMLFVVFTTRREHVLSSAVFLFPILVWLRQPSNLLGRALEFDSNRMDDWKCIVMYSYDWLKRQLYSRTEQPSKLTVHSFFFKIILYGFL